MRDIRRTTVIALAGIASLTFMAAVSAARGQAASAPTSRPVVTPLELRALCNVSDYVLSRPADRWRGLLVTDALASKDSNATAYAALANELDAAGNLWGTYISGGYARLAPNYQKTPAEAVPYEGFPAAYFFPKTDYDERGKRRRFDLTQQEVVSAFSDAIAREVSARRARCLMLDNIAHPDSEGSSAPVSPVTNRKITWADECNLIGAVRSKLPAGVKLFPNVACPAGLWPEADVAPYMAVTDGVVFETPFLSSPYVPRNVDNGVKIITQLRRFTDGGDSVFLIPWVTLDDSDPQDVKQAQRDAEAKFIAAFALLIRRTEISPVYVTADILTDKPDWATWAQRLGSPLRDTETVEIRAIGTTSTAPAARRYLQREFTGGSILLDPAATRGAGHTLPGVAIVTIR